MHTAEQPSIEHKATEDQTIADPAMLRRRLGRVYRLILDYGCWKKVDAQVRAQDGLGELSPQVG